MALGSAHRHGHEGRPPVRRPPIETVLWRGSGSRSPAGLAGLPPGTPSARLRRAVRSLGREPVMPDRSITVMKPIIDSTDCEAIRTSCSDPPAFAVIFDRHWPQIYRYCVVRAGLPGEVSPPRRSASRLIIASVTTVAMTPDRGCSASRPTWVDSDATIDGQPAIKITAPSKATNPSQATETTTLWVSPGDDRPLEWIDRLTSPTASGQTTTQSSTVRWENYKTLTGSAASPSLVSLAAEHPSAKTVKLTPSAWNEAYSRLFKINASTGAGAATIVYRPRKVLASARRKTSVSRRAPRPSSSPRNPWLRLTRAAGRAHRLSAMGHLIIRESRTSVAADRLQRQTKPPCPQGDPSWPHHQLTAPRPAAVTGPRSPSQPGWCYSAFSTSGSCQHLGNGVRTEMDHMTPT